MIDYIEADRKSGKPFLASINFLANHIPVQAPDSDIARYTAMYRDGWTVLGEARAKRAVAVGILPAGPARVTMPTERDRKRRGADEPAAEVGLPRASYQTRKGAGSGTGV